MRTLFMWAAALLAKLAEAVPVVRTGPVVKCIVHEFSKRPHAKVMGGVCTAGVAILALMVGMLMGLLSADVGALMAFPFALALPEHLKAKKEKHDTLVEHIDSELNKHDGALPQNVADDLDGKAKEAESLWKEIEPELKRFERLDRVKGNGQKLDSWSRQVDDPTVPAGKQPGEGKGEGGNRVAGYLTLGQAVAQSEGLKRFIEAGMPDGPARLYRAVEGSREIKGGRGILVPLTKEQRTAWEQKAAPTVGADVIEPDRIGEVVRVTEQDRILLRDLLNVSQTTRDAVTYRRISSVTRAAAAVAQGATKPEVTMALDTITESVRTQAVHMPVHNNQLADIPDLRNMIDNELLYDLRKYEEEQVAYGAGTGEEFEGIVTNTDVQAARTEAGDTLLDIVRRMVTDVRRAGYEPNGLFIDPLDWETIELLKGTDDRYVWAVIRDTLGPRVWGLRVVESSGAEANEGNTTERRNMIVGDWMRGATLWVRETPSVAVGWVDAQFTTNMRTLLAEQRAAFGVKRPNAFRKHETEAAVV